MILSPDGTLVEFDFPHLKRVLAPRSFFGGLHMSAVQTVLAVYGFVMMATIAIQILYTRGQVGVAMMLGNRENFPKLTGIAGRLDRAQANNVVAMALFAPAILLLGEQANATALFVAQIFLAARIFYVIFYASDHGTVRMVFWCIGFLATGWLYFLAF